jgi:hypothetical protein
MDSALKCQCANRLRLSGWPTVYQMTTPNPQGTQNNQKKRYLIPGIVMVCFLIGGITIWIQRNSHESPTGVSPFPTPQINLPTVQYPTIPPSAPEFTVAIHSLDSSGITGTATFKDIAGSVAILLHLDGLPAEEESEESITPAELHSGTCTAPGPLAYPMSPPDAGESETDLSINLKEFNTQKPLAVILYKSAQDHTAIACGDIQ